MYIKKLELVNFQVIKEFTADFTGNVYFISGENELGKSTLLKAIGVLLTGQRDEVLRLGEKKGFAKMVVGGDGKEYEVSLSFTDVNPRGTLSIKCNGIQSRNVSMLQELFGYQDFDAVEFLRWSETKEGRRRQVEVVKSLLPKAVVEKMDSCDMELAQLEQKRLELGREVKTYKAIADEASKGLPENTDDYKEEKDLSDLLRQQQEAARLIEKAKTVRATLQERITTLKEIPDTRKQIEETWQKEKARLEAELAKAKENYENLLKNADALEEDTLARKSRCEEWLAKYEANNPENTDFSAKIAEISAFNDTVKKIAQAREKQRLFQAKNEELEACLYEIADKRKEKADAVLEAKLPINGLAFDEDGLMLNNVPFVVGKISDSQAMEVAAKMVIAANPKVKVFRIARGESLGQKRLDTIVKIAKKYGYQGFIEQVQRGQDEMKVEEYTER